MPQPFKDAVTICKAILRNGFDAYVVNMQLQKEIMHEDKIREVDIACECTFEDLVHMYPTITKSTRDGVIGELTENGTGIAFYLTDVEEASYTDRTLMRITPYMLKRLRDLGRAPANFVLSYDAPSTPEAADFEEFKGGVVHLRGIPDLLLRRNYLLAIRAMRFAANLDMEIHPATWIAIVRSAGRVLDYVPMKDIMEEWKHVEAENMWKFVQLLFDSQLLHGLLPEIAALDRVIQDRDDNGTTETVFEHTIACMKHYPEEEFHHDWYGTLAMMFHDVGKLFTADYHEGQWTFYQHHRVGAKVSRRLMHRMQLPAQEVDLICHLVRHHMRFHFMLTDRGLRRFVALDEYPRIIEMARADIKARNGSYTYFNHNHKYLERAAMPEEMFEPFLNGNEIMRHTGLKPGPEVGHLREKLLSAQVEGLVQSKEEAIAFVQNFKE
ncbi:MAG: HD domain-containing protein [Pseudomonadota bacterium]